MKIGTAVSVFTNIVWAIVAFFAVPIVAPVVPLLSILLAILGSICSLHVILTLIAVYGFKK